MNSDQIIDEAIASSTAKPQADTEKPVTDPVVEKPVDPPADPKTEEVKLTPEEEARREAAKKDNKIKYRDKKILRLKETEAENKFLRQEVERLRSAKLPPAPKESDFVGKDYGEFLNATTEHVTEKKINDHEIKAAEDRLADNARERQKARDALINESAERAREAFPDFDAVVDKHSFTRTDGSRGLKLSLIAQEALSESENTAFAIRALLLEEGALETLNGLSPGKAAAMVARYEDKGLALSKIKKVSSAPEPMDSPRGLAAAGKPLHERSIEEKHAFMNS